VIGHSSKKICFTVEFSMKRRISSLYQWRCFAIAASILSIWSCVSFSPEPEREACSFKFYDHLSG
jgi:hypothetical protein